MSKAPAPDRFETVAYVYNPGDLALLLSLVGHAGIHEEDLADAQAVLATLDPVPYRARLPFGFWPLDLLLFLAIGFLGVGASPRQIPTYVLGESVRREA